MIDHRVNCFVSALISAAIFVPVASYAVSAQAQGTPKPLGIFEDHGDIGTLLHPGSARYDSTAAAYTVSGSGDNMWFGQDDFHFVWKRMSGDVAISAGISFVGSRGNDHRKAVLMIRQSLDGNSPAVDVARHGDGLTSLQFRDVAGDDDHEVQSNVSAPERVRLEKRGDRFYAFVSGKDGQLEPAGASTQTVLHDPFYVGIGVSAHDKDDLQSAIFSNVKVEQLAPIADPKQVLYSSLETVAIASTDRRVAYVAAARFEAPNWSREGTYFVFNREGGLYRLGVKGGEPERIPTGSAVKCNNDHGISPDGKMLAISGSTAAGSSLVYTASIAGGATRQITMTGPSYWHGWSPDGAMLAFTGQRGDNFDIYTIPAGGGDEKRLTTDAGLDDGPEYSPDGTWIYFNSERTGSMQIWRMHPDGSNQEQVISDTTNDWFPHLSPDGKWMVYLSYASGVKGHPPDKDVTLNLMSIEDKKVRVLARLLGGQGTINVPPWSPDSTRVAFVSYEYLQPKPPE